MIELRHGRTQQGCEGGEKNEGRERDMLMFHDELYLQQFDIIRKVAIQQLGTEMATSTILQ